jgi:uncharacterized membrane protein (DUF485 family)
LIDAPASSASRLGVLIFVLCGVYSYISNNKLDALNEEAMREVEAIAQEKGQH